MWYPEETVAYCQSCDLEIPIDCFWRGRGSIIVGPGRQHRTTVLYSQCPKCGQRQSVGLEGPWYYRALYGWLWRLRYPYSRPPALDLPAAELQRRRAAGE